MGRRAEVRARQNEILSMTEIVNLDAVALSRAIKSKQVSCVEVMTAYLDQIERLNPRVNAIVSIQPREVLLDEAKNPRRATRTRRASWLDARISARGQRPRADRGHPHDDGLAAVQEFCSTHGLDHGRAHPARRRDHNRENQRAGVRAGVANLQSGLWHDAQRVRSIEDVRRQQRRGGGRARAQDGAGGGRQRPRRIAAKSRGVQQRVRLSDFVRASAVASSSRSSRRRSRCTARWRGRCPTSRCFFR